MKKNRTTKMLGVAFFFGIISVTLIECKKDTVSPTTTNPSSSNNEGYTSINDFFAKNGVVMQTYTISGSAGGNFTSPQGTQVTIPSNAFVTSNGIPITGDVTIQFKDIYKKSDMLLSNMPTQTATGLLKSGGEFFIKAIANESALLLATGKNITVSQPATLTGGLDTVYKQEAYVYDTTGNWSINNNNNIFNTAETYVYNLYQFNAPVNSGSWCNSDNPSYFSAYQQSSLTFINNDNITDMKVSLVFKTISTVDDCHTYNYISNIGTFLYSAVPKGLQCTLVAIGVKNGIIYSSFVPITIGDDQSINFSLNPTTTTAFKTALQALN